MFLCCFFASKQFFIIYLFLFYILNEWINFYLYISYKKSQQRNCVIYCSSCKQIDVKQHIRPFRASAAIAKSCSNIVNQLKCKSSLKMFRKSLNKLAILRLVVFFRKIREKSAILYRSFHIFLKFVYFPLLAIV